jgi:hypothetical protein
VKWLVSPAPKRLDLLAARLEARSLQVERTEAPTADLLLVVTGEGDAWAAVECRRTVGDWVTIDGWDEIVLPIIAGLLALAGSQLELMTDTGGHVPLTPEMSDEELTAAMDTAAS